MHTHSGRSNAAFTLVELSIVLVILGLLVGGVLSGQALIHSAELRAVTTEFTSYKTALNTFRDKYFAVPGDMPNAVSYWGAAAVCSGADTATSTCNGNGDGQILQNGAGVQEDLHVWQHLKNAGLIEGSYTGIEDSVVWYKGGVNVPRSRYSKGIWSLRYFPDTPGDSYWYAGHYGNTLQFGGEDAPFGDPGTGMVLKPEDAYNLDMKLDDGKPGTGIVSTWKNADFVCVVADNSTYDLANQTTQCFLLMKTGY